MFTPGTPGSGHGRTLRVALVTATLLLLLGVVALSSRSGFGQSTDARPTPAYINWAMSVFLVVFVLMIPVGIYLYGIQIREYRAKTEPRSFPVRVARGLAWIALLGLAVLLRPFFQRHFHFLGHTPIQSPPSAGEIDKRHHNVPYTPTFQWPVLWATLVLFAGAAGVAWYRIRHGTPTALPGEAATLADDVAASISDAIDDLEAEPDARRAVIAAYARMESTFERNGLPRAPNETAIEYLRRILLELGSRVDAVTGLTRLFELAKFSRHEIDATMKHEAIAALTIIRDDLRGAPA